MTASELITRLRALSVDLRVDGERLRFQAPPGGLPAELRNELVRRKQEVLACLRQGVPGTAATAGGDPDGKVEEGAPDGAGVRGFPLLLSPLRLGPLSLRNRIAMSPMEVDFGDAGGAVTNKSVAYYAARAQGGAALIVVEATCVDAPEGLISPYELRADDDTFLPGLRRLAQAIQAHGASAVLQLQHAGRKATESVTGRRPVAPSAVESHNGEVPRELSREEISRLVERFAAAAARAQVAGFDGMEIHAAHGYLVSQFLSPTYNRRRDDYGGSSAGRARFLLEIVAAVRRRVGTSYPLLCRLSAVEIQAAAGMISQLPGGLELAASVEMARWLERAGVTALDVSATLVGAPQLHPMSWPEGRLAASAAAIKAAVSIPVSVTSRVSPRLAEELLRGGGIDFVRLGRALLADPDLPRKLGTDRWREVRPCIYCSLCVDPLARQPEALCTVNPDLGREVDTRQGRGEQPAGAAALRHGTPRRSVAVVGGGPAGLTAARVAAEQGHRVLLFEQEERLGGQLLTVSKSPAAHQALEELRRYLVHEVERLAVEVRCGERCTAEQLAALGPDLVVLAAGAVPVRPAMPIAAGARVLFAGAVFAGATSGDRVVVVGSGQVGCEAALRLAEQGRQVTLVGRSSEPAQKVPTEVRAYLLWALAERGVTVRSRVQAMEIAQSGIVLQAAGERQVLAADTVVLAAGARPHGDELAAALAALESRRPRVVRIGDCRLPRSLRQAIAEGTEAGLLLAREGRPAAVATAA